MAECQALLNPKDSYSCRWGLGSSSVTPRFHNGDDWQDCERENTSVISSTKLWQSTESSVYDTEEAEDSKPGHDEHSEAGDTRSITAPAGIVGKQRKGYCGDSFESHSPIGSNDDFSIQHMLVEVQPFTNGFINGPELISAVMRVRCCGLLRWEVDSEKPENRTAFHFSVAVDKDIFDVHNLALEMDQALSSFTTCSVAVKSNGSHTHHYLVGGTKSKERRPSEEEHMMVKAPVENKPSKLRKLLKSRSFLSTLSPFTKSASSSGKLSSAGSVQSLDGLSILQEIATELKTARKEIKEVQNHVHFLSRHISNLTLDRPKTFHHPRRIEDSASGPPGISVLDDGSKPKETLTPSVTFTSGMSLDGS